MVYVITHGTWRGLGVNAKRGRRVEKFPLWLHKGKKLWCRKHCGDFYYFGSDKEEALRKYVSEWKDGKPIQTVRVEPSNLTLVEACNQFLTAQRAKHDAGRLSAVSWTHYHRSVEQLLEVIDKRRLVAELRPADFAALNNHFAKHHKPETMAGLIRRIRGLFKYLFLNELIATPIRFGSDFSNPLPTEFRLAKAEKGERFFEAEELRRIIDAAPLPLRAMVLLGVNCGFGQSDCSELNKSNLRPGGWIDFPRPKTGIERRCKLWAETQEAMLAAMKSRPDPLDTADGDAVFITKFGKRFVRFQDNGPDKRGWQRDSVGQEFNRFMKVLKIKGRTFYDLRRTFRTVADDCLDQIAIARTMGHIDSGMSARYRQRIDDKRLVVVSVTVRKWLFG